VGLKNKAGGCRVHLSGFDMFQIEVNANKIVNFWIFHKVNKFSDQLIDCSMLKKHSDLCG
jgi:Leu/Phe-tRNA-protein transferase